MTIDDLIRGTKRILIHDEPMVERQGFELRYNGHPNRQNNVEVAEMYSDYKAGMSLAQVGKKHGRRTRQAVYDIFKTRGYELRTKKLEGLVRRFGISFTFDGHGCLRGSKAGKRVYLHRMVWEEVNGPLPADHVLTFKDGNRANVELENLELVPMSMMSRRFNPAGRNQFSV